MSKSIEKLQESLSPLERKIVPHLNLPLKEIARKTNLDKVSILRALKFLQNHEILEIKQEKKEIIDLGTNGIYYKKKHLPERQLITFLENNNHIAFAEGKKQSKLSDNEFKAALGVLKDKAILEIKNGKLTLNASKEELIKKSFEEQLIELLPIEKNKLEPEHQLALVNLQKRKEIIEITQKTLTSFELTNLGKQIAGKQITSNLLEEVTPEIIKNFKKNQKFRPYDIQAPVPVINGGKKHFVNEAIRYGRRIWLDLGFKEMTGSLTQTSFWNFDTLFQPQDHPARDMHDTFFLETQGQLPDKKIVEAVKKSHESGLDGSKGWQYEWKEEEAKKVLLRTHTTCLSSKTLSELSPSDLPVKFFAIGKCFRNETVDWSHGFEFYQSEGIVIDPNVTLSNLLGYLKEFYKKMGFEKVRFTPGYFPYTEPSVEVSAWHPEKEVWLELGGAGIFRPEVTIPLLGSAIPVLAWGQGFDRIITDYYKIKDLREMYNNDLKDLRNKKAWLVN